MTGIPSLPSSLPELAVTTRMRYILDKSLKLLILSMRGATLDSYTVWNARLAFASHQLEGLEVALYANNISDEFYYGTGNVNAGLIGAGSVIRGMPKNYGLELYYSW